MVSLRDSGGRLSPRGWWSCLVHRIVASYTPFRLSMRDDGNLPGQGQFPATRWSLIVAARSAVPEERQRALEILIAAYWKPVYKYIRLRWDKDNEQAQDLTQDFFLRVLEQEFLVRYDP